MHIISLDMKSFIPTLVSALAICRRAQAVTQGIPQALLNQFVQLATINVSPYIFGDLCTKPGGIPKIADIANSTTTISGWLLRDDTAQQIIISWRGTETLTNFAQDTNRTLADYDILPDCVGCQIEGGFYEAWVSVYQQVEGLLAGQVAQYPNYDIIITGHSLGGSLAALTASQFANTYPNMTVVTMGEPRTGNPAWASYIDAKYNTGSLATTRMYRTTHENDGVVANGVPASDGYQHHGLEIWNLDPTSVDNTYVCMEDEENLCCEGQGGEGINLAHLTYWGETVVIDTDCGFF